MMQQRTFSSFQVSDALIYFAFSGAPSEPSFSKVAVPFTTPHHLALLFL
jgi:hypothetical protein